METQALPGEYVNRHVLLILIIVRIKKRNILEINHNNNTNNIFS